MFPSPSSILRRAGCPVLLILHSPNIRYLTSVDCSEGAVVVTADGFHLFVDDRYGEAARSLVDKGSQLHVHDRRDLDSFLRRRRIIGVEAAHVTLDVWRKLQHALKHSRWVQTTDVVEHFRRSKNPTELRALRRADHITQQLLEKVPSALTPGMRETDLAELLRSWAYTLGADDLSFPSIVAFGPHTSRPHHHPGNRRLRTRDIVLVDCGARFHGYCGDRTQMYFVGSPTQKQQQALDAVRAARDAAIAMVRSGASTRAIDACARSVLRSFGMEAAFVHALGHGVGLNIHEGVSLSEKGPDWKLLPHEVITIEPGVYFPGKFGIRLEEMVVVER